MSTTTPLGASSARASVPIASLYPSSTTKRVATESFAQPAGSTDHEIASKRDRPPTRTSSMTVPGSAALAHVTALTGSEPESSRGSSITSGTVTSSTAEVGTPVSPGDAAAGSVTGSTAGNVSPATTSSAPGSRPEETKTSTIPMIARTPTAKIPRNGPTLERD